MASYIDKNRARIAAIKDKLKKKIDVDTVLNTSNKSFSIILTYSGLVENVESALRFEIKVDLAEDVVMDNYVHFFKNHNLSIRASLKSKKGIFQDSDWHFDTENIVHNLMHPKYHFQYGGIAAKGSGKGCFNTPRIMTLPIDYVIAIDFFLCNFFDEDVANKVRIDNTFASALRDSQTLVLKGYYNLIARYIRKDADEEERKIVKKILPPMVF